MIECQSRRCHEYGVGDGIRTRDVQIHSLALYQLSYTHRIGVLR